MEADIVPISRTVKVVKKRKGKKTKELPRGKDSVHIFFEAVPAVYYPAANDLESEEEMEDVEDCFLDDFMAESLKGSCGHRKSGLKKKTPSTKTVRLHNNRKLLKRESNVSENSAKQKANIEESLIKRHLKRTGLEMYFRRIEPAISTSTPHDHPSTRQSKSHNRQHHHCQQQDHPSVKQYELHKGDIPSSMDFMRHIADLQHRDITPEDYELLLTLDEGLTPKTIGKEKLNAIQTVTVKALGITGEVCSICMEQYQDDDLAKELPCNHHFHASCINHWLSTSSQNCPLDTLTVIVS